MAAQQRAQQQQEQEQQRPRRRVHSNRSDDECDSVRFESHPPEKVNGGHMSTSGDEDEADATAFAERHVGFTAEAEERDHDDDPERVERHAKLHRRDTPHHLKNKRINLAASKADEEKVRPRRSTCVCVFYLDKWSYNDPALSPESRPCDARAKNNCAPQILIVSTSLILCCSFPLSRHLSLSRWQLFWRQPCKRKVRAARAATTSAC